MIRVCKVVGCSGGARRGPYCPTHEKARERTGDPLGRVCRRCRSVYIRKMGDEVRGPGANTCDACLAVSPVRSRTPAVRRRIVSVVVCTRCRKKIHRYRKKCKGCGRITYHRRRECPELGR